MRNKLATCTRGECPTRQLAKAKTKQQVLEYQQYTI